MKKLTDSPKIPNNLIPTILKTLGLTDNETTDIPLTKNTQAEVGQIMRYEKICDPNNKNYNYALYCTNDGFQLVGAKIMTDEMKKISESNILRGISTHDQVSKPVYIADKANKRIVLSYWDKRYEVRKGGHTTLLISANTEEKYEYLKKNAKTLLNKLMCDKFSKYKIPELESS